MAEVGETPIQFYRLSSEEIWELQRVLEKRVKNKLSEGLSPEGKMAMEQAREDSEQSSRKVSTLSSLNTEFHILDRKFENGSQTHQTENHLNDFSDGQDQIQYSDADMPHLECNGDVIDEHASVTNQNWDNIGDLERDTEINGKENVYEEAETEGEKEEIAIEETAKRNSVEKCLDWMEINGVAGKERKVKTDR